MSEAELQRCVLHLARILGWQVAHFRPARTAKGWRTPVEADGKGWPDLVLCKDFSAIGLPGRLLFRELKADRGRLSVEQAAWIARLQSVKQDARVWTAADWHSGFIERELRGG